MLGANKSFPNIPCVEVGMGKTFTTGVVEEYELCGKLVRFKAIGATSFKLAHQPDSSIVMTAGETEYFFIPLDCRIQIVSGSLNLMW